MQHIKIAAVLLVACSQVVSSFGQHFATEVISYTPGTGVTSGYTNPNSSLGEPSRVTPGEFGGPVDPYAPPYLAEQLVSIGANGSLTVRFGGPVLNNAANPFGIDFLIFGGSGFTITNGNYSGGGVGDGTLFGNNTGTTRVSVSEDNITYYALNPSLAPVVDGLFPTDGSGNFTIPVDPSLTGTDFSGKDLTAIRALYGGSAGGTGYNLDWAIDAEGLPVGLSSIQYLRIEVLSGKSDIDGFVSVVPEPSTWSLITLGIGLAFVRFYRRKQ
ncbi:MAG: PEP-CTERM sorting domain-containing protein [Verrucomicrobiota bacterium]|nr:PEP-CTERM sorting domain-containing protein [Verrucomicrobiota bacterium]